MKNGRLYFPLLLLLLVVAEVSVARASAAEPEPVVFIHGAWGGAHHWKAVADTLGRDDARIVRRASLTGLGERSHLVARQVNLQTHVRDVVNLIEFDDLNSVVLVAHSYGGVVASGVAEEIPDRISRILYLDTHLLENGESYLTNHPSDLERLSKRAEEAGDGWLIPVDWPNPMRDTPHPLATLTQALRLSNPAREKIPASYWLFADGGEPEDDVRYQYLMRAKQRGWPVKTFAWGHNPQRSRPEEVAEEIAAELATDRN